MCIRDSLHASHAASSAQRYKIAGYAALVVQAGTATSTRKRGEENSFNVIRVDTGRLTVERYSWQEALASFELASSEVFCRNGEVWESTRPAAA